MSFYHIFLASIFQPIQHGVPNRRQKFPLAKLCGKYKPFHRVKEWPMRGEETIYYVTEGY